MKDHRVYRVEVYFDGRWELFKGKLTLRDAVKLLRQTEDNEEIGRIVDNKNVVIDQIADV